jgi:serine/threonine protein phosphatase PrpC
LTAETYKQTDQEYLKAENNQHRDAGSTASTAVLVGDRLLVANVGDSRAVICIAGKGDHARFFHCLSSEHHLIQELVIWNYGECHYYMVQLFSLPS